MSNPSNILNHSPADILRRVIISLTVGTDPDNRQAWPVYAANEPNLPDNCITVYDSVGRYNGRLMNTGRTVDQSGFQVRVRSETSTLGYARACLIRVKMCEEIYDEVITLGTTRYRIQSVNNVGEVIALGKELETSKRFIFVVNGFMVVGSIP
jgi:hypothetical protein